MKELNFVRRVIDSCQTIEQRMIAYKWAEKVLGDRFDRIGFNVIYKL